MQMQLPIFPQSTTLVNGSVGFFEKDDFVYYLHNGSPIYCHQKDDLNSYRYITANLVVTNLCSPSQLARSLGVNSRNIQRYAKALREKGSDWFFKREAKRGDAHKLTAEKLHQVQTMLDESCAVAEAARVVGVTEGALRYHLKKGSLKKSPMTRPLPGQVCP